MNFQSRTTRLCWPTVILTVFGFGCAGVRADTVELGGQVAVTGKVVRKTDSGSKPHVIVELDPELRLAIPQSRIRKIVSDQSEKLVWYRQEVQKAGEDAEAHYELARSCKAKGLLDQRDYHFKRAIEIDPNHSRARSALNYVREGNGWILYADQQRSRGLIQTSKGWQVPEVYLREQRRDELNEASKRWVKEFTKLRTSVLRGGKRSDEALAEIMAIEDPLATSAISEALEESRGNDPDPKELRMIYVKKLGSFKTGASVRTLVRTGLFETDPGIRTEALRQLQEYGAASAVASYLPILTNESHKPAEVTAALRALNYFPDPELWREYVDALITTHKTVRKSGGGMSVGTNSLGGSGLSTGSKQEVIVDHQQNPGALELLREITGGVDHRYDQDAWKQYFAQQLLGSADDLRRDP